MSLTKYYYQFTRTDLYPVQFDSHGIPHVYLPDVGHICHPITIANWGLHLYNCYIESHNESTLDRAINLTSWLIKNHKEGIWFINFPNNFYKINPPWPSAMVQGQAIGLLSRIGALLKRKDCLKIATLALKPFSKSVTEGGVLVKTKYGDFYEEYPSTPPSLVLNGFIFSLFGLHDLGNLHNIETAKQLYLNGLNCLKNIIDQYDTGFWTRYDLYPIKRHASQEYHKLHISLLKSLLSIVNEPRFTFTAKRWQKYRNSIGCQMRWLINKLNEKLLYTEYISTLKLRIK